jgi:predicted PurR-regulated permease PerM
MSRLISLWLLIGAIALLFIIFYKVMASFLVPLFLAALLVVIFGPLHRWILNKVKGRARVAAALTTAAVLLIVLVPFILLATFAALEGRELVAQLDAASLKQKSGQLRESLDLYIPHQAELVASEEKFRDLTNHFDNDQVDYHLREFRKLEASIHVLAEKLNLSLHQADVASEQLVTGFFGSQQQRTEQAWDSFLIPYMQSKAALARADVTITVDPRKLGEEAQNPPSDRPSRIDEAEMPNAEIKQEANAHDDFFEYQNQLLDASNRFRSFKTELMGGRVRAWLKETANPTPEELKQYSTSINQFVQQHILSVGGATTAFLAKLVVGIAIMIIALYFFLLDGPAMISGFKFLSPLDDQHEQELLNEFSQVSRAVVVATLLSAIAQGLLAGIGYYFAGLGSVFLLMLLTTALALVPFVGAASVWIPACLWLYFVDGRMFAAIALAIYGVAVISMIDNLIKPYILHGQSNLHPLLALLSVLGGVTALGPIGILIGPMVVVFLQTLLKILKRELSNLDNEAATSKSTTA